ncbi:MAG: hypothetical protein LBQ54_10840 [Planctomycetaceae bacterium]|jgi:hypothetical protein|nr:hypothetical protein [Planctomycetaceae bacterium]
MPPAGRDAAAGGWSYRSESRELAPVSRWNQQAEKRFQHEAEGNCDATACCPPAGQRIDVGFQYAPGTFGNDIGGRRLGRIAEVLCEFGFEISNSDFELRFFGGKNAYPFLACSAVISSRFLIFPQDFP